MSADNRVSAAKNAADNQLYIFPINQVYILLNFFDPAGWPMLIYGFSHSMGHRIFSCITC